MLLTVMMPTVQLLLPARYHYTFPEGFEEVEKILTGSPLKAYDGEQLSQELPPKITKIRFKTKDGQVVKASGSWRGIGFVKWGFISAAL